MTTDQMIRKSVQKRYPKFGVNKLQEITRLVFEIQQKEEVSHDSILEDIAKNVPVETFHNIKSHLIRKRFPNFNQKDRSARPYLPRLDIDQTLKADIRKELSISPKDIYIEKSVKESRLAKRTRVLFPKAAVHSIESLGVFMKNHKYTIHDYNNRRETFFIVREKKDFFKKCPCSPGATHCGYHVFNIGAGCPMECTYCYLQEYINTPGIILPANIDEFFEQFEHYPQKIHIGTGEMSDSLALDLITQYSTAIVDFFKRHPNSHFEFKTKSVNIENLLRLGGAPNIIVSWSVSPQEVIEKAEYYTAPVAKRIEAALECAAAGYRVGFHFDPVFHYDGWEESYRELVGRIFDTIKEDSIHWMSIGTFRFSPKLKKIIENRFPGNQILKDEIFPGFDGKMRYHETVRKEIYKKMSAWIRARSTRLALYLCMEDKSLWRESGSNRFAGGRK